MTPRAVWLALIVLGSVPPAEIGAQVRSQAQIDSLQADSLRRSDSLRIANVLVEAYDRSREQQLAKLAPLPPVEQGSLRPALTRTIFTRDSIDWITSQTLSDLLALIPGVMVLRGGSFGRPEQPAYWGRGTAAIEYTMDGVPWVAMGDDSLAVDPTLFSLVQLERIEVDQSPGVLRVHLYTRRHDGVLPRTRIGIASGDYGISRYSGAFEKRFQSGVGLTLAAEYFGINAPDNKSGGSVITNGQAQLSWFRDERWGAQFQYLAQLPDRDPLLRSGDTLSPQLKGTRSEQQLRLFWQHDPGGLGPSINAFAARSKWKDNAGLDAQDIGRFGLVASWRQPVLSAQIQLWHNTQWTPLDLRASAGWSPVSYLTSSMDFVWQRHDQGRESRYITGNLGVRLPWDIELTGTIGDGQRVQNPSLVDDPEQKFTDLGWKASWQKPRFGIAVGYLRNDAWRRPAGFHQLYRLSTLALVPPIEWGSLEGRYALASWLTLSSVYQTPLLGLAPGAAPPNHAISALTVRSKFLRNFPSGAFDLKAQIAVESWSSGVAGLDEEGEPMRFPGKTFLRGSLQLQIGPFIAYYDRANLQGKATDFLPGYPVPALSSTFGVRWSFLN